ncbi:NAD(P)H dehydrogenase [Acrasis kona]|uniref:NAD(P)H dehydrogenase n=1 Tax=Acrasis kona TaxID=1008807 RepID=A0AAW2ZFK9_9EUKA
MTKVLILFYSTYGHIYQSAEEIAKGAREVEGVTVDIKQVPETFSEEVLAKVHATEAKKAFEHVPVATPSDLAEYDAVVVGSPGKYGNMASQMKAFFDACGQLWATNALVGKVGACFTSTASQHGGNEATLLSIHTLLFHFGLVLTGLPYSCVEQNGIEEVKGGSPYGVTTIAGGDGSRQPSESEKTQMRFFGKHISEIAKKLSAK